MKNYVGLLGMFLSQSKLFDSMVMGEIEKEIE
jgi:hypothetical protein